MKARINLDECVTSNTDPSYTDLTTNAALYTTSRLMKSNERTSWYSSLDFSEVAPLQNRASMVTPLMPQRPSGYPDVQIQSFRAYINGRFVSEARVRWVDTATADLADISVSGIGTTLRGARQQRQPTGGWAIFNGMRYDVSTATMVPSYTNSETLDTP
jgi:hypothetical protein